MPKNASKSAKPKSRPKLVAGHKHGRVPRAIREQQILDIAEKQFIEKGYADTTVESVRLEAGVSRPIIYEHYGSKDKLYLACVKRAREQYQEQMKAIWQHPGTPRELLMRGSELYFSIVEANPRRWLVLFSSAAVPMMGDLGDQLAELRQGTIDMMITLIKANAPGIDAERAEAIAQAIFAVGEHLGRWWLSHPEIPRERILSHHTSFILQGLSQLGAEK